jgi:metal-sulfur cluster biosynthetic enzyme
MGLDILILLRNADSFVSASETHRWEHPAGSRLHPCEDSTVMGCSEQKALDRLRSMKDPASRRDIVSLGLVKRVQVNGVTVTVELRPLEGDGFRDEALAAAIERELSDLDGVERVKVTGVGRTGDRRDGSSTMTPLHLPILDDSPSDAAMSRADMAPGAGYGPDGPTPLPSPELEIPDDRYEGWPPVYQWQIDPKDPDLVSGEKHVSLGEWEYDIWWQEHPSGLVYAAIQALHDDTMTTGPQREHPMGRNVVVNIVWDDRRGAVVAVYGTARDFRPFIEAFRIGCGLEEHAQETES